MNYTCRLQWLSCLATNVPAEKRCGEYVSTVKGNRLHMSCPECGWFEPIEYVMALDARKQRQAREYVDGLLRLKGAGNVGKKRS